MSQGLLGACEAHAAGRPARYVFLGDYIDRGPDSRGVIQLLMRRQQAQPGTSVCCAAITSKWRLWRTRARSPCRCGCRTAARPPSPIIRAPMAGSRTPISRGCALCRSATMTGCAFFVHAGIDLAKPLDDSPTRECYACAKRFQHKPPGRLRALHSAWSHPTPDRYARSAQAPHQSRHRCGHGWRPDGSGVRRHPNRAGRIPDGPRHEMNSRLMRKMITTLNAMLRDKPAWQLKSPEPTTQLLIRSPRPRWRAERAGS